MRKFLSTVLFIIGIASGSLDLVCFEDARYVIWSDGSSSTSILRETGTSTFQYGYLGKYGNLSISLFNSGAEDYIAAGCTNESYWEDPGFLLVIDPQTLGVVNSREVSVADFGYESGGAYAFDHLNLQKYYSGNDSLLLVGSIHCCVTGKSYIYPSYLGSSWLDVTDTGSMSFIDTLTVEITPIGGHTYAGPVSSQNLQNLSATEVTFWAPYDAYLAMESHLHQVQPVTLAQNMWSYCFLSVGPLNHLPLPSLSLLGIGSNSSECLVMWADTLDVVVYTVFTDSIVPQSSSYFQFFNPGPEDAVAFSCNPDDPGMLMVWYEASSNEIRARHYQDEWNDFDHTVALCLTNVQQGNIAVYGVDDGYWVAWLPSGEDKPELAFIERSTVTGITFEDEHQNLEPSMRISSNPFSESVAITVENADAKIELYVFDMSGRVIRVLEPLQNSVYIWDGSDDAGLQTAKGVYLIRCEMPGGCVYARLVRL